MGEFAKLAQKRQSCRSFCAGAAIERKDIDAILRTAVMAPSAGNSQPWRYIAVDEPHRVKQLAACALDGGENDFCLNASAFIVALEEKKCTGAKLGESLRNQKFISIDIGGSVAHIILAAADIGIASCVIGFFNERKVKTLLGIPKTRRIRLLVALGTAADGGEVREKERRPFEETVTYNKF